MKTITTKALVLCSIVTWGQTNRKFEMVPPDNQRFDILWRTVDETSSVGISKDNVNGICLSFGGITYKGKIIDRKLILDKPFILTYDTCRQTVTILDTKLKKSSSIHWYRKPIYLTNLKQQ